MMTQHNDDTAAHELMLRVAVAAQRRPTIEWLLVAACGFAAVSAALERAPWPAAGFTAIAAAALLRALRLTERSLAWRWIAYLLLAFSIALYVLRLILRLSGSAAT